MPDWRGLVEKLVGENAIFGGDDGWMSCFFCEGEGSWDASGADHDLDCIWIEARHALATHNGTMEP